MATRNLTMVVHRKYARDNSKGLAINPGAVSEYSYVNMYLHHDGYPEWQAVQLANWLKVNNRQDGAAMAAKLVHDHKKKEQIQHVEIDNQYRVLTLPL